MGTSGLDATAPAEWLAAVQREERRGEPLAAFDLAERGLAEHPDSGQLKHRAVLALARSGATEEAARRFLEYGLADSEDEDIAALRARIAKDRALLEEGDARRALAARAAELYAEVYSRTGGYYPAVNAATLWLLAGEHQRSRELAAQVVSIVQSEGEDSYYAAATRAEAELLLGHEDHLREALATAASLNDGDYGALATTRRQLREICRVQGIDAALLAPLAGPGVALTASCTSCCHLRARSSSRARSTCGPGWAERFDRCLNAAVDVRYATDDAFLGDDVLFRYGGELAMGLALLRARYLDGEARQLALWDGKRAHGHAGTAIDVATWRATGRPATIVSPGGELIEGLPVPAEPALAAEPPLVTRSSAPGTSYRRVIRAMLFGDVRGFSKLTDDQLPTFATRVLGAFSDVIDRYGEHVEHRNTWGDAVYIVLRTPAAAAACALELQAAMTSIDLEAEGLPSHLALRLGGHVGPVFPVLDPVIRQKAFMGSHVSRTARIEPVAPAGTVYVTAPFAAALILRGERRMTCDYVGHMPAAKGYGKLRMYRLQATPSGDRRTK